MTLLSSRETMNSSVFANCHNRTKTMATRGSQAFSRPQTQVSCVHHVCGRLPTTLKTDTVCSISHFNGRKNTSTTWISQTPVAGCQCRVRKNKMLQCLKSWLPKRTLKRYLPFSLHQPWKCPLHRADSEDKHSLVPQGKRTSCDQPWATDVQGEEIYLPNYHQRQIKYRITAKQNSKTLVTISSSSQFNKLKLLLAN